MTKVYIYKLTVDDGGAPCVSNGTLSLAICKPAIRSTAMRGDIILGFAANCLYRDNRLVYVARITKNMDGRKYFLKSQYTARPDCIYIWDGRHFEWKRGSRFHSPSDVAHDLGRSPVYNRAHVLLSQGAQNFRYFAASCPVNYKRKYCHLKSLVEALGQGHRVNLASELREELRQFIQRLWDTPSAFQETAIPDEACGDKCSRADRDFAAVDC